jgi:hypothetical protein
MRAASVAIGLGLVLVAAASASAQPRPGGAVRPEYKWCYTEPPPFSFQHCRFNSIEECRPEIYGMGGFCTLNPRYVEPASRPAKPRRR